MTLRIPLERSTAGPQYAGWTPRAVAAEGLGSRTLAGQRVPVAGGITAIVPPQAALIRRLIARNAGVSQYCRGADSWAYCSVKGRNGSVTNTRTARTRAARPRP